MNAMLIRLRREETKPEQMVTPLIKRRVYSVENEADAMVSKIGDVGECTLFYILKDAAERSQLLAMFMALLELIKIKRVLIIDTEEEPEDEIEHCLLMKFTLNSDFTPPEGGGSEFD